MLKIGEFSGLSRISIRMLRHYDEVGLLKPQHVDEQTGYRYYNERQLADAGRIASLRDMGFGVQAIGEVVGGGKEALEHALRVRRAELIGQRELVSEQLIRLDSALQRLGKDDIHMKYEVTCKTLPERYVASVRDILPGYYEEGRLWHTMMQETACMNMQPDGPCYAVGVYHDTDYRDRDVDVEIQMSVKGKYQDTEHVKFKTVPPIFMASATYTGSYEKVNEVNADVAAWVQENGYEFDGLSFCIYHVSPHETQNPDELVTEVCYPVRKKEK
ncbi:MerR family transcriptional regulator [Agathobaculum sp.]|uniref:MerR family transcriptional regulator n=1 Tax=Agathobaculum sp. TaxID=2048138 RepID=UPI002A812D52|nr:MerR family transcriptional regulator [Agathobaculum sp.]MDY3617425.1 MerR family transcriptional regulator [Agathobaculum sp.]